nr:putative ribonuclease H-like domain-containing protein [Tanacetum cinerariifolium]
MDVKSAFLYGTIKKEVYVCQPPGFEDLDYPDKVYKVVKALYGLHQAPRAWYETLANYLLKNGFQRGKIDQTLFIKNQKGDILLVQVYVNDIIFGSTNKDFKAEQDRIFISKDKYVAKIFRKFSLTDGKPASTPIDTEKPLHKDPDGEDVDVHTYRSMIGSLMYLTSSRPDIMFAICVCARFQVTPKASHLHAVKRIFRYLKGKPHLRLSYPKDSPINLVAYSDSDYSEASLDRKSTIGGCQFLGYRLISWQSKKKNVVATSSTKAEYIATASCCAQVLWIQNQLLDYGSGSKVQLSLETDGRFFPKGSKEEAKRIKRKGINLEQESAKKQKSSEEITEEAKSPEEVTKEKVKEMMHLVPIEEVYVEALQVKHPIIEWKVHSEGQKSYWKITRLGGSSACYRFFIDLLKHLDREDLNQL